MKACQVQIANRLGLHARAAARFVQTASRFAARVSVSKDASRVDDKSILGLLTLAASKGSWLQLVVEGVDEQEALLQLERLVRERFGESQ